MPVFIHQNGAFCLKNPRRDIKRPKFQRKTLYLESACLN